MSGYQVVIDKVLAVASAASRVADELAAIDCSGALPAGDAGMPGGQCPGKLTALRGCWQRRRGDLTARLGRLSEAARSAAQLYEGNESAAAHELTTIPAPRGPRAV
ncbi:hypothetical protein [Amycolatopsis sp. NPDC004378]